MPTPIFHALRCWTGCLVLTLCCAASAEDKAEANRKADTPAANKNLPPNPFPDRPKAPEIDGGVEWLNTSGPIALKELRGKLVLLDFWTFCCINCMHVIPDLKFLEHKYPKELAVIGVHSAKFDNEKDSANIRNAILRYEIEHPVINDAHLTVWRKFGVSSWPTLVLIDPEGHYCGSISGEGNREVLDQVLAKVIEYHRAKGTLDEKPLQFDLEKNKQTASPLRFPGKVLADAEGDRLFISDSNHNRIVITSLGGKLQDVIGTGAIGRSDGAYRQAEFDHPQGMALVGQTLYVADTENHMLRQIDLTAKTVTTLSGNGEQGQARTGSLPLQQAALNSPWDLLALDGVLYICMAGPHQIWSHQIGSATIQPYAGSGREDIHNGGLSESALAQPSGITTDGAALYVCDSEGSAVRKITASKASDLLAPRGQVSTVAGTSDLPRGRSLFEFGDVTGKGDKARFQHPLGVAYHDGSLYVADSYNHKIKKVNIKTRDAANWLGTGKAGDALKPPQLDEPAGLSFANDKLYVADTNNHRVCVVDVKSKELSVLTIAGLEPPKNQTPAAAAAVSSTGAAVGLPAEEETVPVQKVAGNKFVDFEVAVQLPPDFKLNPEAPVTYTVKTEAGQALVSADAVNVRQEATLEKGVVKFRVPLIAAAGVATLHIAMNYQYCRDGDNGVCKLGGARYAVPVQVGAGEPGSIVRLQAQAK